MANRNKKKRRTKQKYIKAKQAQFKPKEQLNKAASEFDQGNFGDAASLAQAVLSKKSGGETDARATRILVESLFRAAADADSLTDRVSYLDSALGYASAEPRLHLHKGITLLRQGKSSAAIASFDKASKLGSTHPQLSYLRQLAQSTADGSVNTHGLSPDQAGILQLLGGLQQGTSVDKLLPLVDAQLSTDQQDLWRGLLQMMGNKSAAPVDALQQASKKHSSRANPLLHYYLGVAAMRAKKPQLARDAWGAIQGAESEWLSTNLSSLLSEELLELGQKEAWNEIVLHAAELDGQPGENQPKALQEVIGTAYFHRGNQHAENQEWLGAVGYWEKANEYISNRLLLQNLALAHEATESFDEAAASWRAMIKRRPRKESHPDYLTDAQVAAIWARAATCYACVEDYEEMIPCLKNAIKYDEENIKVRLALVEAYMEDYRIDAAINELQRVLEIDDTNIPALERLGALYTEDPWRYQPVTVWRRILEIDPNHPGARDALAEDYVQQSQYGLGGFGYGAGLDFGNISSLISRLGREHTGPVETLKKGLEELPNHPLLLFSIGEHLSMEDSEEASDYFYQAWQARPQDLQMTARVIISLLVEGDDERVEEMLLQINKMHRPPSQFWMAVGKMTIDEELDTTWVERFLAEALAIVESGRENTPRLQLLVEMFDYAGSQGEEEISEKIGQRIRKEEPNEGGPEFVDAWEASESGNKDKALRQVRRAISKFRKAGYVKLVEQASMLESMLSGMGHPMFELHDKLARAGFDLDGPPPDPEEFFDILDDMDEETVNEIRKIIGF